MTINSNKYDDKVVYLDTDENLDNVIPKRSDLIDRELNKLIEERLKEKKEIIFFPNDVQDHKDIYITKSVINDDSIEYDEYGNAKKVTIPEYAINITGSLLDGSKAHLLIRNPDIYFDVFPIEINDFKKSNKFYFKPNGIKICPENHFNIPDFTKYNPKELNEYINNNKNLLEFKRNVLILANTNRRELITKRIFNIGFRPIPAYIGIRCYYKNLYDMKKAIEQFYYSGLYYVTSNSTSNYYNVISRRHNINFANWMILKNYSLKINHNIDNELSYQVENLKEHNIYRNEDKAHFSKCKYNFMVDIKNISNVYNTTELDQNYTIDELRDITGYKIYDYVYPNLYDNYKNEIKKINQQDEFDETEKIKKIKEISRIDTNSNFDNKDKLLEYHFDIETKPVDNSDDILHPDTIIFNVCGALSWSCEKTDILRVCIYYPKVYETCKIKPMKGHYIIICKTEKMLLHLYGLLYNYCQFDIQTGFNTGKFDIPMMFILMKRYNYDVDFCRMASVYYHYFVTNNYSGGYNTSNNGTQYDNIRKNIWRYHYLADSKINPYYSNPQQIKITADLTELIATMKIPGMINLDLFIIMRKAFPKMKKFKLNVFLKKFGEPEKIDLEYHVMWKEWIKSDNPEMMQKINEYCAYDGYACKLLLNHKNYLPEQRQYSLYSYISLHDSINRAGGLKAESMLFYSGNKPRFNLVFIESYINNNIESSSEGITRNLRTYISTKKPYIKKQLENNIQIVQENNNIINNICDNVNINQLSEYQINENYKLLLKNKLNQHFKGYKIQYEGANVICNERGRQNRPITAYDYASLYPSTWSERNLSQEYLFTDKKIYKYIEKLNELMISKGLDKVYNTIYMDFEIHLDDKKLGDKFIVNDYNKNYPDNRAKGWSIDHQNIIERKGVLVYIYEYLFNERNLIKGLIKKVDEQNNNIKNDIKLNETYDKYKSLCNMLYGGIELTESKINVKYNKTEKDYEEWIDSIVDSNQECIKLIQLHNYYDAKQLAIKVQMNTFYGVGGSPISLLYFILFCGAITYYGRKALHTAINCAIDNGYKFVYSDTDSIYIAHPEHIYKDIDEQYNNGLIDKKTYHKLMVEIAIKDGMSLKDWKELIGKKLKLCESGDITNIEYDNFVKSMPKTTFPDILQETINKFAPNEVLKMVREETLFPSIFCTTKMYIGVIHNKEYEPNGSWLIRGFPFKKEGASELLVDFSKELFEAALYSDEDLYNIPHKLIKKYYYQKYNNLQVFLRTQTRKNHKNNVAVLTFCKRVEEKHNYYISQKNKLIQDNPNITKKDNRLIDINNLIDMYEIPEDFQKFDTIIVKVNNKADLLGRKIDIKRGEQMEYLNVVKHFNYEPDMNYYISSFFSTCGLLLSYHEKFNPGGNTDKDTIKKNTDKHFETFIKKLNEKNSENKKNNYIPICKYLGKAKEGVRPSTYYDVCKLFWKKYNSIFHNNMIKKYPLLFRFLYLFENRDYNSIKTISEKLFNYFYCYAQKIAITYLSDYLVDSYYTIPEYEYLIDYITEIVQNEQNKLENEKDKIENYYNNYHEKAISLFRELIVHLIENYDTMINENRLHKFEQHIKLNLYLTLNDNEHNYFNELYDKFKEYAGTVAIKLVILDRYNTAVLKSF